MSGAECLNKNMNDLPVVQWAHVLSSTVHTETCACMWSPRVESVEPAMGGVIFRDYIERERNWNSSKEKETVKRRGRGREAGRERERWPVSVGGFPFVSVMCHGPAAWRERTATRSRWGSRFFLGIIHVWAQTSDLYLWAMGVGVSPGTPQSTLFPRLLVLQLVFANCSCSELYNWLSFTCVFSVEFTHHYEGHI